MIAHSKIGASSMDRWSNCPGSVKASEGIPNRSSPYAAEGTLAHDVASKILLGEQTGPVDPEMLDAVQTYTEFVFENAPDLDDGDLLVEHRFDLSKLHPGLFGTADCVIYQESKKHLMVIDYKHGQGLPVEVIEDGKPNVQLMYYGLGAILTLKPKVETVELVIVQPRCFHPDGPIRSFTIDAVDMLDFASDLVNFARETEKPNAPLKPGDHCRFCPAQPTCPEIHKKAVQLAQQEFTPVFSYDPQKLSQTLEWLGALEGWIKGVREFAYAEAQHGRPPPGWKLVEKRATRRWRDEKSIADFLENKMKFDDGEIYDLKLRSPAQIEKQLGKDGKKELESFIVAESSGFTLARDNDKRPAALRDPKSEFTNVT